MIARREPEAATPGRRAWGWRLALGLVATLVVALVAWVAWAGWQGGRRETRTVEELARGQGRWVDADDARLYVREWGRGDAPVVLLVNGAFGWSGTWFALPDALAGAGWHVAAVDLPPFGLTRIDARAGTFDYGRVAQARRLLALVASLGRPVRLVAHGEGAGPALEAALRDAGAVRGLVLVDPALGFGPDGEAPACTPPGPLEATLASARGLRTALVRATVAWPGFAGPLLRRAVVRRERITPERVLAFQLPSERIGYAADVGDWLVRHARDGCGDALSLDPVQLRRWSPIHAPVRFVYGSDDAATPSSEAAGPQRWLYASTLATVPGTGHLPFVEDPDAFAKTLLRTLDAP